VPSTELCNIQGLMKTGFYGHAMHVIVDVECVLNVLIYSNEQRKNTKNMCIETYL
jgi:hypothetical protein